MQHFFGVPQIEAMGGLGLTYGYETCWGNKDGDPPTVCPHAVFGFGWRGWRPIAGKEVIPYVKVNGDAVVFQPEIVF